MKYGFSKYTTPPEYILKTIINFLIGHECSAEFLGIMGTCLKNWSEEKKMDDILERQAFDNPNLGKED